MIIELIDQVVKLMIVALMKYPGRGGGGSLRAVHPALTKLLALDNNDLCAIDDPGIDQYQIDDNQNKYYQIKSHSLIQCLNNM